MFVNRVQCDDNYRASIEYTARKVLKMKENSSIFRMILRSCTEKKPQISIEFLVLFTVWRCNESLSNFSL